ncbi:MAG: hypothetical protein EXR31_06015 [Betaproteobacteria bacterium]|nr:hypothetical protein [Betaproteobacteria bacterium]
MQADPKFDEAQKLIDEFAAQLLALNDSNAIPTPWAIYLKKALTQEARTRGRKRDYAKVAEVVKRLALVGKEVRKGRTKIHNPATIKDHIARNLGVSRKTVERIDKLRPEFMAELPKLDLLRPNVRKAVIDGLAGAISTRLSEGDERDRKARVKQAQRRFAEWVSQAEANFEPHKAIYFDNRQVDTVDEFRKLLAEMADSQSSKGTS